MKFKTLINEFVSGGCDEFVTLYTSSRKPWEHEEKRESSAERYKHLRSEKWRAQEADRFSRAQQNQQRWLSEVRKEASFGFGYLTVIENRPSNGDCMFHTLLRGCDWDAGDFGNLWARRWHEISGGIAFEKTLDGRIGGLLRYFAEKRLLLELDGERYTKQDFDDWKTY